MEDNLQEIDLQSNRSERQRKDQEKIKQTHHLTDEQLNIFVQMQSNIKKELDTNADFQGQNKAKVTDVKHLIRQLHARNFNLEQTMEMWRNWMYWRKKYEIDNIDLESIENEFKSGKAFWHKYDKEGNPCCVVRIKNHIPSETTHDNSIRFMIYLMEVGIKMAEKSGTEKMSVLWDREGFSSKNFDLTFITLIKSLITMFQDNYAERLAHVFILYPSVIMKYAFNIFKPLLAEKVRSKIQILNDITDLKNYFEEDNILKIHGGKSLFEYSYPNNILSDPLSAVLPYIAPTNNLQLQQKLSNQSFSFKNHYPEPNGEMNGQEVNERSSCFFSIENNSTEFFNFENSYQDREESEEKSKSFNHNEQNKQEQFIGQNETSPQNNYKSFGQDQNLYQEDFIYNDQQNLDHKPKSPAHLQKYSNLNNREDQVITSGCCGCKSDSSCTIF